MKIKLCGGSHFPPRSRVAADQSASLRREIAGRRGAERTCERTVAAAAAAGEPDPGSIACKRAAITLFNCLGLGSAALVNHTSVVHSPAAQTKSGRLRAEKSVS